MKGLKNLYGSMLMAGAIVLSPSTVYAQDIEIYFSNPEGGGGANLVMMLDTSGSMDTNECVEYEVVWNDTNGDGIEDPDELTETRTCLRKAKRMDELKTALFRVLDALGSNARIGVGQYNQTDGGRLLYPVRGLDEVDFDGTTTVYLLRDAADANDDPICNPTWPDSCAHEPIDYDEAIETMPNDNEAGGVMGFIFQNTQVPRGATVQRAYLQVNAAASSNDVVEYEYWYEPDAEPALFDAGGGAGEIMERSSTGDEADYVRGFPIDEDGDELTWEGKITGTWSRYRYYNVDVTEGVQHAFSQGFWCGGSDLALYFTNFDSSSSDRRVYMRDAVRAAEGEEATAYAPRLVIEWDASAPITPGADPSDPDYESTLACGGGIRHGIGSKLDDAYDTGSNFFPEENGNELGGGNVVGMRFTRIPYDVKGGTPDVLRKVTLNMQGTQRNNSSFNITIAAVPGNGEEFQQVGGYLKSLPTTAIKETVTIPRRRWQNRQSVDITDVVQEAMESTNWARNDDLVLLLTGTRRVDVAAFESGAAAAPFLEFDVSSADLGTFLPRVRDRIKEVVQELDAYGSTPSMESYVEMARYMLGKNYQYAREDIYTTVGMIGSGPQYESPVSTNSCDSNNIVLLTDGSPTNDNDHYSVENLINRSNCNDGFNREQGSYNCQVKLAEWLYNGTKNGLGVPIATHTIAFTNDEGINAQMTRVSSAGDGLHRKGRNADELQAAFEEIINSVTVANASMAAPGVAVNQLNRFRHLDQLYYALFKPSTNERWLGNLKRYRLAVLDTGAAIVDENDNQAIDPNTGFFRDGSNSFWGEIVDQDTGDVVDPDDGQEVTSGGALNELAKQSRKLFINKTLPAPGTSPSATSAPSGEDAVMIESGLDVSASALGLPASASDSDRETLYQWLRSSWGDPLHSEPVLVNYGFSGDPAAAVFDASLQDNTILVANNDGMVMAIDADTGAELFAWMPPDELAKTNKRFINEPLQAPGYDRHYYGLDGGMTVWRRPRGNGVEHVYAYVSQRRGGEKMYALDLTDREQPKLMWAIDGTNAPYENLAQSWSQPALAQIRIGDKRIPVLVMGGGFSAADHDAEGFVSSGDVQGNSLYIINAWNGALIWSASDSNATVTNGDMKWSVAASPSVVDIDFDGITDYIYFSDLGGQVFRVDLNRNATGAGNLALRVATLAKLGTSSGGGISNHRRFFAEPVIALSKRFDKLLLQVAIGSGYRPHPLDKQTNDKIYIVDDWDALDARNPGATISPTVTEGDLVDLSSNFSPSESVFSGKSGWYIRLQPGEKVLSEASIIDGRVFMTSYIPESTALDRCTNVIGGGRLYVMNVLDGSAAGDFNGDGDPTNDGRALDIAVTGIPPGVTLVVTDGVDGGGTLVGLAGTYTFEAGDAGDGGFQKTRWFQVETEADLNDLLMNKASQYP